MAFLFVGKKQGETLSKVYQWLLVRGRVAIRSENSKIILELDPEGSAYCVLSAQDARDIAGIIADDARTIWEASGKVHDQAASIEGDVYKSCRLTVESGVLQVMVHDAEPFVAVTFDSKSVCGMNVAQSVAFVQILHYMIETIEGR